MSDNDDNGVKLDFTGSVITLDADKIRAAVDRMLKKLESDPDVAREQEPPAEVLKMIAQLPTPVERDFATSRLHRIFRNVIRKSSIAASIKELTATGDKKQVEVLLRLAGAAQLFHDAQNKACARIPVAGHWENWRLDSETFELWLLRAYYRETDSAPGAQALKDAIATLRSKARFDGQEHEVHLRVANLRGRIYLDLCDQNWRVVEIDASGWRVVADPPVRFHRSDNAGALPIPAPGNINKLRGFLNVSSDSDFLLAVAWQVAAFFPGPYPILVWLGEQGTCKSTHTEFLRQLLDPNTADLRSVPATEDDLLVLAVSSWITVIDNVSRLTDWLSDGLCRLATGGGLAKRELYTDFGEVVVNVRRPIILNGIADMVTRGDLHDRALIIHLEVVPETQRKEDKELKAEFEQARPEILGGLLDLVAIGLRELPKVKLKKLPRLADFARLGTAIERALGHPVGSFLQAYSENKKLANEDIVEASVVAMALRTYVLEQDGKFDGTASQLLKILAATASEKLVSDRYWPKTPTALGKQLTRVAPALRLAGLQIDRGPRDDKKGNRAWVIGKTTQVSEVSEASETTSSQQLREIQVPVSSDASSVRSSSSAGSLTGQVSEGEKVSDAKQLKTNAADASDTSDTSSPTNGLSNKLLVCPWCGRNGEWTTEIGLAKHQAQECRNRPN